MRFAFPRPASVLALALCTLSAAAAAQGAAATPGARDSLASVIPDGAVTVDVLTPEYPRHIEELAVRMDAAARRDPAWFQQFTRQHPGVPPYDPRLGVTAVEYQEYVSASRTSSWRVRERATLTFERHPGTRRWTLHGWGVLAPLEGTVIDLDDLAIQSRKGPLAFIGIASPERTQGALDWRWFGTFKAAHRMPHPGAEAAEQQALDASLHIGPLTSGHDAALYWTVHRSNGGQRMDDQFLLLRFPARR